MEIKALAGFQKQFFQTTTANRVHIGSKITEFLHEKLVEFRLIDRIPGKLAVQYRLHNQIFRGSTLMHRLAADLEELYSDIIFITSIEGDLQGIYNYAELNDKWSQKFIPHIQKIYPTEFAEAIINQTTLLLSDKEKFLSTFKGFSSWRFFFRNWYRQYEESETEDLTITGYFNTIDLPLTLNIINSPNKSDRRFVESIESTAILDSQKFDRPSFARMLKDLTRVYNIDASLSVEMEERFTFCKDGTLNKGEMFLETSVADWYTVTSAHEARHLDNETFKQESLRFEKENATEEIAN